MQMRSNITQPLFNSQFHAKCFASRLPIRMRNFIQLCDLEKNTTVRQRLRKISSNRLQKNLGKEINNKLTCTDCICFHGLHLVPDPLSSFLFYDYLKSDIETISMAMNNRLKSGQRGFSVSPHSSKVYCCSGLDLRKNRKFWDFFGRGARGMIKIKFSKQKSFLISFCFALKKHQSCIRIARERQSGSPCTG